MSSSQRAGANAGGQRLMISRMELENFKSYAGTQAIGPFHKSFSSIVGPNGSGKSNVIDALLFVFGKKAKQLRLSNLAELIHKSSRYPDFEYARVSIYFQLIVDVPDSEDSYDVVPNSEFTISRVVYKDSAMGNKYLVNDKKSSYTEVGQLLRSYGVDLDNNRFLILQGEVEQISMMKPKAQSPHEEGLLGYLEDIIGSNQYIEQIDEASKELDGLNDQRVEKVNRLKLAEKERDNLLDAKVEAESFLEKERGIRRQKNILCQMNEQAAQAASAETQAAVAVLTEKLQAMKVERDAMDGQCAEVEREYETVKAQRAKIEKELQASSTQHDAFERKDVKLQEDMKHTKANYKKFQAAVAKESKKEAECGEEAQAAQHQLQKYQQAMVDFEAKKAEAEAQVREIMEGLQEGTADMRAELEAKQQRLSASEKAAAAVQADKDVVSTALQLVQARRDKAQKTVEQQEEKLQTLRQSVSEESRVLQDKAGFEKATYQPTKQQLQTRLTTLSARESALQQQVTEAVVTLEQHKAAQASQQTKQSANHTVQQVLKAARLGGALASAGVRGRLGDLASIAPTYDVAVTTACKFLDHIVVETTEGAQQCVEYLRKMQLGRASFIVLQLMEEYRARMNRAFRAPASTSSGACPRLFDLLEDLATDDLAPAFYMALRDTLVAPDLDTAVAVAYVGETAQFRVVTMDGQVIDTSGAMSGGGKEVRRGGMRLSSGTGGKKGSKASKDSHSSSSGEGDVVYSAEQIAAEEAQVSALQDQLHVVRADKAAVTKDLQQLEQQFADLQRDLERRRLAVSRLQEQETAAQDKIAQMQRELGFTPAEQAEIAQHTRRLEELEAQILVVAPDLRAVQAEVSSLQRQILSFGGPKLAKAQARVDSWTAQIESVTTSFSTKEVEVANLQKQAEKAQQAKVKAEEDMQRSEQKLEELVSEQRDMENDALLVVRALETAKAQLAELEAQLATQAKVFGDISQKVQKLRTQEIDLQAERDRVQGELAEQTKGVTHWHHEAEALRKQHAEEMQEFARTLRKLEQEHAESVEGSMEVEEPAEGPEEQSLPRYSAEELSAFRRDEIQRELSILETERNKLKGNVNMNALLEYLRKDHVYRLRLRELEAVNAQRTVLKDKYESLRRLRLEQFMQGFGQISLRLKEMYQMITLGGDAELELLDSLDPFSEGIAFSVRPPKKSWKQIGNLSGGEKTLASLALVFALHYYKPTPLYVMDEIDAALDFKNVSIVAHYIKERTKDAQFIIISLRNNMFELADRLVGIYKTHDATKSVTINPKKFGAMNATQENDEVAEDGKATATAAPRAVLGDATNRA